MRIQFRIFIPLLLLFACEEAPDLTNSVLDTDIGSNTPQTTINDHEDIFNTSTITLNWTGEHVNAFRYRLEPVDQTDTVETYVNWSNWGRDTTSVTLKYLDEGNYNFHVEGRFNMDYVSSALTNFEINAINGPALRIYPLQQTVNADSTFDIYLFAEEVPDLAGIQVEFNFDSNYMTYESWNKGSSIAEHDDLNIFPEPVVSDGSILMSGVVAGSGLPETSEVLKLTFTYVGTELGSTEISIDLTGCGSDGSTSSDCNTYLRDIINQPIQVTSGMSGMIEEVE